jgi:FdhD protein
MAEPSKKIHLIKIQKNEEILIEDSVAVEEPLEIRVEGKSVAIVMRTPGNDKELAAGFLLSEGVITNSKEIFEISECPSRANDSEDTGNYVDIILTKGTEFDFKNLTRHVYTSSSCGICGKATIESAMMEFPKLEKRNDIIAKKILDMPAKLLSAQETFKKTGGLHASALFDQNGEIIIIREDVGRHNALDKVIGFALLNDKLPLSNHTLLLSGRISFELMQKSLAAGIPTVAGISAPSSLAVDFARKSNQNLIGFLRNNTMNLYTQS